MAVTRSLGEPPQGTRRAHRHHQVLLVGVLLTAVLATSLVHEPQPLEGESIVVENHVDLETRGMEGGAGRWTAWYATAIGRSTRQAAVGTASLRVDISGPNGWGVALDNWPGFAASPGHKVIGFQARKGSSAPLGVSMRVSWRNSFKATIRTDTVSIPSLLATWQTARANVVAPSGTAFVSIALVHRSGGIGDHLFVDEVIVGSRSDSTTTTASTRNPGALAGHSPSPAPTEPPARICGNTSVLAGPASPPPGAITVPAGDNSDFFHQEKSSGDGGKTYWFEPGTHTLGLSEFGQIQALPNSQYVGAPGAVLDGRGINRYAFTHGNATGVRIAHLTVQNFAPPRNEGVVNQGSGTGWTIEANTVRANAGGGIVLGTDNIMRRNCITANGQLGFKMYRPQVVDDWAIKNVTVTENEISHNNTDDWETQIPGCGCTGGGKFWDVKGATVTDNWVHHNRSVGLWADTNNANFTFSGNLIEDNDAEGLFYEISYNFAIVHNTFRRNGLVKGQGFAAEGNGFPVGAVYISESGGDGRISDMNATSEIRANLFEDNWSGVVLWENANRFCNSPINTSKGYCTRVGATTHETCSPPRIASEPLYSDCRWKTQNVSVRDNDFRFSRAKVGCGAAHSCGKMAIISNWGSVPAWSPYLGNAIQEAITFERSIHFSNNRYVGSWEFLAHNIGRVLEFGAWSAAPYSQDAGSSLS